MKYIDAEKLIAEIERRIESWTIRGKHSPAGQGRDTCDSRVTELSDLLSFVTSLQQDEKIIELEMCSQAYWEERGWMMIPPNVTLKGIESLLKQIRKKLQQEQPPTEHEIAEAHRCAEMIRERDNARIQQQPVIPGIEDPGIPGKDFIPVEWVDACEMYGKWKIVKQEQPEVDLEKEIIRYQREDMDRDTTVADVARHFNELGHNARKDKLPEIELDKFTEKIKTFQERYKHPEIVSIKGAMAFMARLFYQYPNVARQWYDNLPKATMD